MENLPNVKNIPYFNIITYVEPDREKGLIEGTYRIVEKGGYTNINYINKAFLFFPYANYLDNEIVNDEITKKCGFIVGPLTPYGARDKKKQNQKFKLLGVRKYKGVDKRFFATGRYITTLCIDALTGQHLKILVREFQYENYEPYFETRITSVIEMVEKYKINPNNWYKFVFIQGKIKWGNFGKWITNTINEPEAILIDKNADIIKEDLPYRWVNPLKFWHKPIPQKLTAEDEEKINFIISIKDVIIETARKKNYDVEVIVKNLLKSVIPENYLDKKNKQMTKIMNDVDIELLWQTTLSKYFTEV